MWIFYFEHKKMMEKGVFKVVNFPKVWNQLVEENKRDVELLFDHK